MISSREPVRSSFAEGERRLLERATPVGRFLEIGCGEGDNLHQLRGSGPGFDGFALDRRPAALRAAKRLQVDLRGVAGDAGRLPFDDESFDSILIRDLLSHVADRRRVLSEAWRVLRVGGRLNVIERNVRNPLIAGLAALDPNERGVLRSTPERLLEEIKVLPGRGLCELAMERPLPIARAMLHSGLGRSALARRSLLRGALGLAERASRWLVPRSAWAYACLTLTKGHRPG